MNYVTQMLATHPKGSNLDNQALAECIQACFDCAQTCTACADACLGEDDLKMMVRCIGLNLNCADVCQATGNVLSRQTTFESAMARALVQVCAQACKTCGDECEKHAHHGMKHCQVCAEACRRCEQACNNLLSSLGK